MMTYTAHSQFLPNWFVQWRGLAISIAFSGVGVGAATISGHARSCVTQWHQKPAIDWVMEWPPEFILTRLRPLARLKLQPREVLAALRELAEEYKAFLSCNAVRQDVWGPRCSDRVLP
jgi:hypothetical protein